MINSTLYMKDSYLDKSVNIINNKRIIEYDLKSANTSLCKEYKLLPKAQICDIENMVKKKRVVTIGKLMRKNKTFKEGLKTSFVDIRKRFFDLNDIEDSDILSIKKDAIFCLKKCKETNIGECHFVEKNIYSSYMHLGNLELYYNRTGDSNKLDIKGIDDMTLEKHTDYMIGLLKMIFYHLETDNRYTAYNYIKRIIDRYKNLRLDINCYRELNNESIFRLKDSDEVYDDAVYIPAENMHECVDISYNFFNILLPIVKNIL